MNKKRFLTLALVFALMAACGPQNVPAVGPQAWVDAPLHGSTIPLAPYQVIAHGASPSGVSQFELMITGQAAEMIPAPADQAGQTLVYINHMWTPPAPGTYLIQVRAAGPDGAYGPMAEAQVMVEGDVVAPVEGSCMWTAAVNVFVRSGPGASVYPEITAVEMGEMFPVVGKSQDGFFWAIQLPNGPVGYVPMAERFGMVTGNCDVPTLPDPPPPPPPEEAAPQCSDGLDNDGDGRIDFVLGGADTGDRECLSAEDDDESVR